MAPKIPPKPTLTALEKERLDDRYFRKSVNSSIGYGNDLSFTSEVPKKKLNSSVNTPFSSRPASRASNFPKFDDSLFQITSDMLNSKPAPDLTTQDRKKESIVSNENINQKHKPILLNNEKIQILEKQLNEAQSTIKLQSQTISQLAEVRTKETIPAPDLVIYQRSIDELIAKNKTLERALLVKDKSVDHLTRSLEYEMDQTRTFSNSVKKLTQENNYLKQELKNIRKDYSLLENEKVDYQKLNAEYSKLKSQYDEKVGDMTEQMIVMRQRIASLQETQAQEQARHQETKDKLSSTLEGQLKDFKQLDEEIKNLRNQISFQDNEKMILQERLKVSKQEEEHLRDMIKSYQQSRLQAESQILENETFRSDSLESFKNAQRLSNAQPYISKHIDRLKEQLNAFRVDIHNFGKHETDDLDIQKLLLHDKSQPELKKEKHEEQGKAMEQITLPDQNKKNNLIAKKKAIQQELVSKYEKFRLEEEEHLNELYEKEQMLKEIDKAIAASFKE